MHTNLVGYYFNEEQYRLYMSGLIGSAQLSLAQQAVSPVRRPACLPACQPACFAPFKVYNLLKTHHLSDYIYAGRNGCLDA